MTRRSPEDASKMPRRYLKDASNIPQRSLEDAPKMTRRCLEDTSKKPRRCLEDASKMTGVVVWILGGGFVSVQARFMSRSHGLRDIDRACTEAAPPKSHTTTHFE